MCLIYGPVFCSMKKILTIDLLFCFASLFLSFFYILCILQNKRNKVSVATALAIASTSAARSRKQLHPDRLICFALLFLFRVIQSPLQITVTTTAMPCNNDNGSCGDVSIRNKSNGSITSIIFFF